MSVGELTFGMHHTPYKYQERLLWQQTRKILAVREGVQGKSAEVEIGNL
jgi:hypothetical protein